LPVQNDTASDQDLTAAAVKVAGNGPWVIVAKVGPEKPQLTPS